MRQCVVHAQVLSVKRGLSTKPGTLPQTHYSIKNYPIYVLRGYQVANKKIYHDKHRQPNLMYMH